MSMRIFNRLKVARVNSSIGLDPHTFFLDNMAYRQMINKGSFISGPMMCLEKCNDEYDYWTTLQKIDYGMNYFMRPYTLTAFGFNEKDITKSHLLTIAYLQHIDGKNNVITTLERVNVENINKYMFSLNCKTVWKSDFQDIIKANNLFQTVVQTDEYYKGYSNTILELK